MDILYVIKNNEYTGCSIKKVLPVLQFGMSHSV